jgi:ABC-2 type transport system permease protein
MTGFVQATYVEALKARRSRISILSVLGFMLLPLVAGFFIIVLKDPEMARRVGLISAKARLLVGEADWPTYLELLATMVAAGGLVVFGFLASWVFGREFADRTAKDLLALPTSRSAIVLAKFGVIAVWSAGLVAMICLVGLGIGAAVGLPATSPQVILDGLGRVG